MATQSLVDITSLSPKFQDLYAKAKDFVEVRYIFSFRKKKKINALHV